MSMRLEMAALQDDVETFGTEIGKDEVFVIRNEII